MTPGQATWMKAGMGCHYLLSRWYQLGFTLALRGFEDRGSVPWLSMQEDNISADIGGSVLDMIRT